MGGFSLIDSRTGDPKIRRLAVEGNKAAERGADLIRKLLAFAKQQQVATQRVDLEPLLKELQPQLRHLLGSSIELVIGDASDMPAVEIDPTQLQAALTNLVVNARDAMRDGGRIAIELESIPPDHVDRPKELADTAAVAIRVRDDGVGMRPQTLQRVLEPFYTTKSPGKGTGLGLAMVHGLMLQCNGALRIESVLGSGTTVSLFLPVCLAPTAPTAAEIEAELRAHAGGRVLLVEDDELVRNVVTGQLSDWGYSVVQASSAAEAMATITDGDPLAFVITDHALAGSNGVKLVAEVRGIRPNLPILFITGQADPQGLERESVLSKPFSAPSLSAKILGLIEEARRRDERDASLDRLAARFKSPVLNRMLTNWRVAQSGEELPFLRRVTMTRNEMDYVATVAVDQTRVPMTFELQLVGARLSQRAEFNLAGSKVDVIGTAQEISQEGAYRRCVLSRRPTYERARYSLGDGTTDFFERLLLPCSYDGANVTTLIVVVNFDDASHSAEDEQ